MAKMNKNDRDYIIKNRKGNDYEIDFLRPLNVFGTAPILDDTEYFNPPRVPRAAGPAIPDQLADFSPKKVNVDPVRPMSSERDPINSQPVKNDVPLPNAYDSQAESSSMWDNPEMNDLIAQALIQIAPQLVGYAFQGAPGGVAGYEAGQKGMTVLNKGKDAEKAKKEKRRLEELAKSITESDRAFQKDLYKYKTEDERKFQKEQYKQKVLDQLYLFQQAEEGRNTRADKSLNAALAWKEGEIKRKEEDYADPSKRLKGLSGEAANKLAKVSSGLYSIDGLEKSIEAGIRPRPLPRVLAKFKDFVPLNPYEAYAANYAQMVGRLLSGGAINEQEANDFIGMIPTASDFEKPEIVNVKLNSMRNFMTNNATALGFTPNDLAEVGMGTQAPAVEKIQQSDQVESAKADSIQRRIMQIEQELRQIDAGE